MNEPRPYLVFRLDDKRFALDLPSVDRVVQAVEPADIPNPPAFLLGVIDVAGNVIPVLSLRQCFGISEREIEPEDYLLIARTPRRLVALLISEAQSVVELRDDQISQAGSISNGCRQFQGVAQIDEDLVLIQDLEKLLSMEQSETLDKALATGGV